MSERSITAHGRHLAEQVADENEWGGTPPRVRERCLAAESQVERLREENVKLREWVAGRDRTIARLEWRQRHAG